MRLFYVLFYHLGTALIAKPFLVLFTRWRITGKEHCPQEGPLIVVANHLHLFDPPLLGASVPRRIVFMAKEEVFRHPLEGPLVRGYGAFPVRRAILDREALRRAEQVLAEGLALGMFPEGTRSKVAQLQPGLSGAALLAIRSGAPILPVGISGTDRLKSISGLLSRPTVTVNIGPPFHVSQRDGRVTKAQLTAATDLMMRRIAELLPEGYRGVYGGNGIS